MKMGVVGCAGRMGRMLVSQILETDGAELAGGSEQPGSEAAGHRLGALEVVGSTVVRQPAGVALLDLLGGEPRPGPGVAFPQVVVLDDRADADRLGDQIGRLAGPLLG